MENYELSDKRSETDAEKKPAPLFDKKKRIFDIVFLALSAALIFVMWCGGFNFLPLIAIVLSVIAGIVLFFRILYDKGAGVFLLSAYLTLVIGTFIYFLIWGAESFGRNLWWNLVLCLAPILLSLLVIFVRRFKFGAKQQKIFNCVMVFLMAGTSLIYVFFMNLRAKPTVERLWEGHEAYLNSIREQGMKDGAPNVLVILMDDMGYADISSYSYLNAKASDGSYFDCSEATIQTPNIDSIADGGIMMDNFYSSSPVCSPARFSMLTGRYSSRGYLDNVVFPSDIDSTPWSPTHFLNPYQFLENVDGILGDEITYAEVLQVAGYHTGCIGKWNLGDYGEYLPTNQGFDYFYGSHYVNDMTPYNWVEEENGEFHEVRSHKDNLDQSESTRLLTAKMVEFIDSSVENNEKFFAYYTTPWPHYPIFSDNNGNGKGDTTDDTYIDCIEEFDRYLGDIIKSLKDNGVYDDTLIVFTSDNGPGREGATGALRGRKNTTFEGGMKVPLIASYPNGGVGQGGEIANTTLHTKSGADISTRRIESSVMMFDLFPTILHYAGIDAMPSDRIIDGRNMNKLWECSVPADTRIHDVLYYQKKGKTQGIQMPVELNGRVFDFKYYDKVGTENSAFIDQVYKNYLFNLDEDPIEAYSISKTYPEIAAKLNAQLQAFRKEMKTNRRGIIRS